MPMSIICLQNIRECITWVKNMGLSAELVLIGFPSHKTQPADTAHQLVQICPVARSTMILPRAKLAQVI